ncbi:MAG: hypothetical protein ACHQ5A_02395 [Opitutales bacterium]
MMRPIAIFIALLVACLPLSSLAAPPNHMAPTSLTLAATTAQKVGALQGICFVTIQNLDSAVVYYGFDSTVTDSNGIQIAVNEKVSITMTFQNSSTGTVVWLYSVAGTASGAIRVGGAC